MTLNNFGLMYLHISYGRFLWVCVNKTDWAQLLMSFFQMSYESPFETIQGLTLILINLYFPIFFHLADDCHEKAISTFYSMEFYLIVY
jgi:hypothetical protein